jgi:hypothetical protein
MMMMLTGLSNILLLFDIGHDDSARAYRRTAHSRAQQNANIFQSAFLKIIEVTQKNALSKTVPTAYSKLFRAYITVS